MFKFVCKNNVADMYICRMANPLTWNVTTIDETNLQTKFDTFLTEIVKSGEIQMIAKGKNGIGFRLSMSTDVNPFKTFMIKSDEESDTLDGKMFVSKPAYIKDTTGMSTHIHLPYDIIFMKLIPISDNPSADTAVMTFTRKVIKDSKVIKDPKDPKANKLRVNNSSTTSFYNECNKQIDVYAKTNNEFNSVCLPLFYHTIVKAPKSGEQITSSLSRFLREIVEREVNPEQHYGLAFMPHTTNFKLSDTLVVEELQNTELLTLTSDEGIASIIDSLDSIRIEEPITEELKLEIDKMVVTIFQNNPNIYLFIVIVSLLHRLYIAGYCHGDLHANNLMLYKTISSIAIIEEREYIFYNGCLFIDWGFAFRHTQPIDIERINTYDGFIEVIRFIIITSPIKEHGLNMWDFVWYKWFPKVFVNNFLVRNPMLHDNRCRTIFILFQHFEKYRKNFERRQLEIFNRLVGDQEIISQFHNYNISNIALVEHYINTLGGDNAGQKLTTFNAYGGRRNARSHSRSHSRSRSRSRYHFTHKKTNKRKITTFRHRKSNKRCRK